MNFTDFYAKWGTGGTAASLNERQGAQPHFMDLCALLGVATPGSSRQDGESDYIFEQDTQAEGMYKIWHRILYLNTVTRSQNAIYNRFNYSA